MRSEALNRVLIAGTCGVLVVSALVRFPPDQDASETFAADQHSASESFLELAEEEYGSNYADFVGLLTNYRSGADDSLEPLRASALLLANRHGRIDAPRVVEYYADLSAVERRVGLDNNDEVGAYIGRAQGHSSEDWQAERPRLLRDIDTFVARVLAQADFTAAAHALALASEIRVDLSAIQGGEEDQVLQRAQRDALEALAVFDRAGMQTPKLRPLLQLGRLSVLEGRPGDARQQFEACLDLARQSRQVGYQVESLAALIRLARNAGDGPELELRLGQLARLRTPEESWELAREHAMLWIHRDEADRAAQFLLRHRPREADDLNVWRQVLATARVRMGEFSAARELLRRLDGRDGVGDEDLQLLHATVDLAQGDTAAVLQRLQFTDDSNPAGFSERGRSRAAALVGEAHLREGHPALALYSLQRARALAEGWETRMEESHPASTGGATVLGEWLGLHAVVLEARALCDLGRELDAAVLIERAHGHRWRAAARADQFGAGNTGDALDGRDLQSWAQRFELGLVTWIQSSDAGLVVHVSSGGVATAVELDVTRRSLGRAVRRYRSALLEGGELRAREIGRELVQTLFPEALSTRMEERGAGEQRLLLLPHGELERLPFEALPWGEGVLDERVACVFLPELPARRPGAAPENPLRWTLLGDPLGATGLVRLPAAARELRQLMSLLPESKSYTRGELTREHFLNAMAQGRALHVATHLGRSAACASPRFAGVGLELSSGGSLCAQTLASSETRAPLVVLAACETADGRHLDARGLQGISRAFLDAGTRNLLVTLWPVRDDVAAVFSPIYHGALLDGLSPARAARRTRRVLAGRGIAPADWAAFRALGRE